MIEVLLNKAVEQQANHINAYNNSGLIKEIHGIWSVKTCNTCQRPVLAHEHPWRSSCDREKDIISEAIRAEMLDAFNEVFMYAMKVFIPNMQDSTSSMMKSKMGSQSCDPHHPQPPTSHLAMGHPAKATDDQTAKQQLPEVRELLEEDLHKSDCQFSLRKKLEEQPVYQEQQSRPKKQQHFPED